MSANRRRRHRPEQIVRKLRDADAMLNSGKELLAVLQALKVSESTLDPRRKQYGGMKSPEAVRLKKLEEGNRPLKELVADTAPLPLRGELRLRLSHLLRSSSAAKST